MNGLTRVLLSGLMMSGAAHAQEWRTYTYPSPGVAIQFPDSPDIQTTRVKNASGVTLPTARYVVRREGVEYTLTVVNYSSTNADALGLIAETARTFSAKGKVNSSIGARINANYGRELTVTESDGSRSDIAIFFVDNHLYTAVGRASPPNALARAADTARFQQSLQFPDDDGDYHGLLARGKAASHTGPGSLTDGSRDAGKVNAGASRSTAAEHIDMDANQRGDRACAGKSVGDVVQLETASGPVPATCTLTARPNPPSGSTQH